MLAAAQSRMKAPAPKAVMTASSDKAGAVAASGPPPVEAPLPVLPPLPPPLLQPLAPRAPPMQPPPPLPMMPNPLALPHRHLDGLI